MPIFECDFRQLVIHTAKCDVCERKNTKVLRRCIHCRWSICSKCYEERNGDLTHGKDSGLFGQAGLISACPTNDENRVMPTTENEATATTQPQDDEGIGDGDHQGMPITVNEATELNQPQSEGEMATGNGDRHDQNTVSTSESDSQVSLLDYTPPLTRSKTSPKASATVSPESTTEDGVEVPANIPTGPRKRPAAKASPKKAASIPKKDNNMKKQPARNDAFAVKKRTQSTKVNRTPQNASGITRSEVHTKRSGTMAPRPDGQLRSAAWDERHMGIATHVLNQTYTQRRNEGDRQLAVAKHLIDKRTEQLQDTGQGSEANDYEGQKIDILLKAAVLIEAREGRVSDTALEKVLGEF